MQLTETYTNIQRAMDLFKIQVAESIDYCNRVMPAFNSVPEMFDFLSMRVEFRNDPDGDELLQSVETLFEFNEHGEPGLGDCDCFTILVTACCLVSNFPVRVVLASNNDITPTHIYNLVKDRGQWVSFDLTEANYGDERKYKYEQVLRVDNF